MPPLSANKATHSGFENQRRHPKQGYNNNNNNNNIYLSLVYNVFISLPHVNVMLKLVIVTSERSTIGHACPSVVTVGIPAINHITLTFH